MYFKESNFIRKYALIGINIITFIWVIVAMLDKEIDIFWVAIFITLFFLFFYNLYALTIYLFLFRKEKTEFSTELIYLTVLLFGFFLSKYFF